ncbi:hypothetical protein I862_02450 [endosymbiont of Acanthamoeba sp. UWC8]|uniref:hypothetical protein n=1 Tax=endosymbiont of Acanthamoeba sp. UWC8 TaxID=86106 RepID=UPI0004D19382|nr:hypothetical protein [endosymbiont of Acanthamoeba sp. UWC8]AIF81053.1 hypothetical protein I862_02450 [endosymbiont of Acanthamoeba sp. UWC8]
MKGLKREDLKKLEGLVDKIIKGEMQENDYKDFLSIFSNPRLALCQAFAEALVPPGENPNISEEDLHKLVSGLIKESAIRAQANTFFRAANSYIVKELLVTELNYHISKNRADKVEQTFNILKKHLGEITKLENSEALAKTTESYRNFIEFNILDNFKGENKQKLSNSTENLTIEDLKGGLIELSFNKERSVNKNPKEIIATYQKLEKEKMEDVYKDNPYLRPKSGTITQRLSSITDFIKDNPITDFIKDGANTTINYVRENPWKSAGMAVGALVLAAATVVTAGTAPVAAGIIGGAGYLGYKAVTEHKTKSKPQEIEVGNPILQSTTKDSSTPSVSPPTLTKDLNSQPAMDPHVAQTLMQLTSLFPDEDKKAVSALMVETNNSHPKKTEEKAEVPAKAQGEIENQSLEASAGFAAKIGQHRISGEGIRKSQAEAKSGTISK